MSPELKSNTISDPVRPLLKLVLYYLIITLFSYPAWKTSFISFQPPLASGMLHGVVLDDKCDAALTELNVLRALRVGDSVAPSAQVSGREPGVLVSSKGAARASLQLKVHIDI